MKSANTDNVKIKFYFCEMGRRKAQEKEVEVKSIERKKENVTPRTKITERNEKFMDFYHNIKDNEDFLALKSHKRVKYLSEQFLSKSQLKMPVGTIYKLLRSEHVETPVTEQVKCEE